MKYFALLTKLGENLLAQATALGTKIELTQMAVGDGGGKLPTPDTNQTKLIAEKRRAAINTLFIDDNNKNQIVAEQIIPEQEGGWWIREIGLFDKAGNLIAVANCPETYKPQLAEGSGRTQSIRMVLIVSHTESVTLKIDPSVVLATREYVNTEITVLDKRIDALSAQTKLDLNKKFDKANISDVKGNDTAKVPSLHLFTGEIGKLQPKGNYAPAGDYATNTALNNGLNEKFDKTGGAVAGELRAAGNITAVNAVIQASNSDTGVAMQLDATFGEPNVRSKRKTSNWRRHVLQDKDGTLAHVGDFGFGGVGDYSQVLKNFNNDAEFIDFIKSGVTQTWRNQTNAVSSTLIYQYASNILIKTSDSFFNISAKYNSNDIRIISGLTNKDITDWNVSNLLTDKNTVTDRNGCIRTLNSNELSDYPVGAPIPWPQATPPAGYLACNGQSFNKASYPLLAKAYPSGVLDDLRAEFIRGLDAGRGVDVGRAVRSGQSDMYKSHSHKRNADGLSEGANTGVTGGIRGNYPGNSDEYYIRNYEDVAASGGNETRPRNIALLYIVRAA
ncbi:phage tail protein [Providencia huaxiensis]|uniref:phage tail-collar fiber domain-containing protein n=1 Tax=Providencia huaxiensis TaxID=2027290 RepID=UPI0032DB42A9